MGISVLLTNADYFQVAKYWPIDWPSLYIGLLLTQLEHEIGPCKHQLFHTFRETIYPIKIPIRNRITALSVL